MMASRWLGILIYICFPLLAEGSGINAIPKKLIEANIIDFRGPLTAFSAAAINAFGVGPNFPEVIENEYYNVKLLQEDNAYARYDDYLEKILNSFIKQMELELNLYCIAEGGITRLKIEKIDLGFQAHRRASLDEARGLHVYVMKKLEEKFNEHKEIRPFLKAYPFSYKQIHIAISFEGEYGPISDGTIEYVSNATEDCLPEYRNRLCYSTNDPFKERLIDILNEPYEESIKLAQESNLKFPFIHQTTDFEEALDQSLLPYARIMRSHGFQCWSLGGEMKDGLKEIGGRFNMVTIASKEEARELAVFAAEELLKSIESNKKLKPFLKEPISSENLKLRIVFTDSRSFPNDEGMESVVLEGNELSFYHEVLIPNEFMPKERWVFKTTLLTKEPYPEALKKVKESPPSFFTRMIKIPRNLYRKLFLVFSFNTELQDSKCVSHQ